MARTPTKNTQIDELLEEASRVVGRRLTRQSLARACGHNEKTTQSRIRGERRVHVPVAQAWAKQITAWLGRPVAVDDLFPPSEEDAA